MHEEDFSEGLELAQCGVRAGVPPQLYEKPLFRFQSRAAGYALDFIVHPESGCAYADHIAWPLRAGFAWGTASDAVAKTHPDLVRYEELVEQPAETIESLYEQLDIPLSPDFADELTREEQRSKRHRREHIYSLEEFGLSRAQQRRVVVARPALVAGSR